MEFDYSECEVSNGVPDYLESAVTVPLGSLRVGAVFVVYPTGSRLGGIMLEIVRKGAYGVGCSSEDYPGAVVWISECIPVYAAVVLA